MPLLKITKEQLLEGFRGVGIEPGDTVYVASSLVALGLMEQPVESTLWALQEAVGQHGTIVMPAFNYGFCHGDIFDRESTPSKSGALTEAFRKLHGTRRTWSPPYHTVTVAGDRAAEIASIESLTCYGRQSVFQYLHDIRAKHLLIGCGYHEGVAQFHWLEEIHEVPYRFWKKFEGTICLSGLQQHRAFFMYARRLDLQVRLNSEPLGHEFEKAGYVRSATVGICRLRAFDLQDFSSFCTPKIIADPLIMLEEGCRPAFAPRKSPIKKIDHIAIVSRYAGKIRSFLSLIQLEPRFEGLVDELGVNCQYCGNSNVTLEFVEPTRSDSRVSHHAQKYPTAPLHHIAFEVDNLDDAILFFQGKGYVPLDGKIHLGPVPYQRVIFLSPVMTGGLLIELVSNDAQNHPAYGGTAHAF